MATYSTTEYNVVGGLTLDHVPAQGGTGVVTRYATLAVSVALVTNDIINLFVIPANCTVIDFKLISDADLGSTASLICGESGDTDRFMASKAFTTASGDTGTIAFAGVGYTPTADTLVYITASSMASGTTDGTIKAVMTYTMNP